MKNIALLLQKEKEYTQSILDLQDSLIVVTDANQSISVNKAILKIATIVNNNFFMYFSLFFL